jgi:hypothetical protein
MRPVIWIGCLVVGCGPFRPPDRGAAGDSLCLTGDAAEPLREVVGRLVAATDSVDRAMADSVRLPVGARVRLAVERGDGPCRSAAEAYAREAHGVARPVVPVIVLRVGDRLVVGDTARAPTSEWALAVVFTRTFRLVSRFQF